MTRPLHRLRSRHARAVLAAAAVLASLAALAGTPAGRAQSQGQSRPNILFVMTDDQTLASLSTMFHTRSLIGRQGTQFVHNFATFPVCCPSRATYLTGQYAHNHRVLGNRPPRGGYRKLDQGNALPAWLRGSGYHTVNLGRTLNGYGVDNANLAEIPPGWDEWYAPLDPTTFNFQRYTYNENGILKGYPETVNGPTGPVEKPAEHQTDFISRRAASLIRKNAQSTQPFFMSVTFPAPHDGGPRDPDDVPGFASTSPPARYRDAFRALPLPRRSSFNEADVRDKPRWVRKLPRLRGRQPFAIKEAYQQRAESLLAVDDAVRNMYLTLEHSGELENTLIMFTSDNGFMYGEHRIPSGKGNPYEPAVRVPLLMRGPGVPRNRKLGQLTANIDLAPTIMDAANAPAGRRTDGSSLFGLLRDTRREWGRAILLENGGGARRGPGAFRAVRTDRYAFVQHYATGEQELYDLRNDPGQLRNLARQRRYRAIRRDLAAQARRLRGCRGSRCRSRPNVQPRVNAGRLGRTAAGLRCVRRGLRVGVSGRDRSRVHQLQLFVGARAVGSTRRQPAVVSVRRRRVRRGAFGLRARVTMRDGRVVTLDRRLRGCG